MFVINLEWVYIKVWVLYFIILFGFVGGGGSPKHRLMNITFEIKIESNLVDWFLKLKGVFSWVETVEDFERKWCHIKHHMIFHTSFLDSIVDFLGLKPYSRPIGLLDLGVSLILAP